MDPIPFDLDAALAGSPVETRNGKRVRVVAHVPEINKVLALVYMAKSPAVLIYSAKGTLSSTVTGLDLVMSPLPKIKMTVYVNIYETQDHILFTGGLVSDNKTEIEEIGKSCAGYVCTAEMKIEV